MIASGEIDRFLLHFHNREILSLHGADRLSERQLLYRSLQLTKYALLISKAELIIFPKFLFETPYFARYLNSISPIDSARLLAYVSSSPDFTDEINAKRIQYGNQKSLFPDYFSGEAVELGLRRLDRTKWVAKPQGSATRAITEAWSTDLAKTPLEQGMLSAITSELARTGREDERLVRVFSEIPRRLDGRAFVLENVLSSMPKRLQPHHRTAVNLLINGAYLKLYLRSLSARAFIDTPLGDMDCGLMGDPEVHGHLISFRRIVEYFNCLGITETICNSLTWTELIQLRENIFFRSLLAPITSPGEGETVEDSISDAILLFGELNLKPIEIASRTHAFARVVAHLERVSDRVKSANFPVSGAAIVGLKPSYRRWLLRRVAPSDRLWQPRSNRLEELEMSKDRSADYLVISITEEEFKAVLAEFPGGSSEVQGSHYFYRTTLVDPITKRAFKVAVARPVAQGNGHAQAVATDGIKELNPRAILVVGTAGGIPSTDFSLGDVVLASSVQDLRLRQLQADGSVKINATGYQVHPAIAAVVAHMPAFDSSGAWSPALPVVRPLLTADKINDAMFKGDDDWKQKVKASVQHHFGTQNPRAEPLVLSAPLFSSDDMVKDGKFAARLSEDFRKHVAFEMEAAGVLLAAQQLRKVYPVLIVRGVSDIVGLERDPGWIAYSCASAARFSKWLLLSGHLARVLDQVA